MHIFAPWSAYCSYLYKHSFSHPELVKESRRFVMVRQTYEQDTPVGEHLIREYNMVSSPAIHFFDRQGRLHKNFKIGYLVKGKVILKRMWAVQKLL